MQRTPLRLYNRQLPPWRLCTTQNRCAAMRGPSKAELKKALSYQITLPTGFEEFVQACIKIDNQIRANREARDAIPRTEGGQFAPTPSTSTGTHSGPMDLSGARYRSQKRGPVTEQEKQCRRDNNLCLYCGSSGHWASQCPHKR